MARVQEIIVPGVHDLVSPRGQFTVELLHPETRRVRKKVVVENAVMDWFRERAVTNGGRGTFYIDTTADWRCDGFHPWWYQQTIRDFSGFGSADSKYVAFNTAQFPQLPFGNPRWLWGSAANVTPDATKHHIPTNADAGLTGGADIVDVSYVDDGIQAARGLTQYGQMYQTWDEMRIVAEWSTTRGNGTWRSIGLGNAMSQRIAPGGMRATPWSYSGASGNEGYGSVSTFWSWSTFGQRAAQAWWSEPTQRIWLRYYSGGSILRAMNMDGSETEFDISNANLPLGSDASLPSVTRLGADFWIMQGQILYRCVEPSSDVAITVNNTYDLSATLAGDVRCMTTDGTNLWIIDDTNIYEVNATTGALTGTQFAHNLPVTATGNQERTGTLHWDPTEELLWANLGAPGSSFDASDGNAWNGWGIFNAGGFYRGTGNDGELMILHGFTTAGVDSKQLMYASARGGGDDEQYPYGLMLAPGALGRWHWSGFQSDDSIPRVRGPYGPSMATHALLPSDIVKTTSDVLRITYDINIA